MTSWVELGNLALSKLGHIDYITSLADSSKAAILINKNYQQVRDYVLRAHSWNFAQKRVVLTYDATAPAWGDGNYFTLPNDWLRTLQVGDANQYFEYKSENGKIFFDDTSCNLLYIYRVEDPSVFDSHFREAYTSRLAYNISMGLTVDPSIQKSLLAMYNADMREARSIDGAERGIQTVVADQFLTYR